MSGLREDGGGVDTERQEEAGGVEEGTPSLEAQRLL